MPRFVDENLYQKYMPDPADPRPEIEYPLWAPNFLEVLGVTGSFGRACEAAGVKLTTLRRYRYGDASPSSPTQHPYKGNRQFCEDCNDAWDLFRDSMFLTATKRAAKGSDRLMALQLPAILPEVYNQPRVVQHQEDPAVTARIEEMRQRILARLAPAPALPEGEPVDSDFREVE